MKTIWKLEISTQSVDVFRTRIKDGDRSEKVQVEKREESFRLLFTLQSFVREPDFLNTDRDTVYSKTFQSPVDRLHTVTLDVSALSWSVVVTQDENFYRNFFLIY